jgi:hypothetical protein
MEKFRIFVYGHKIFWKTDNKALTFLSRCVLASGRVARWVLQLQEYDLHIHNISGTNNFLADALSRSPAGLNEQQIKDLSTPRDVGRIL